MNKVIMSGRLTADPDIGSYGEGKTRASFTIAVDRRFKKDGEPTADFHRCVAFGGLGGIIEKYGKKGLKVAIAGELRDNNWTDKDGVKHYDKQIIIDDFEFSESKKSSESSNNSSAPAPQTSDDDFMNVPDGIDEELPFA